MDKKETNEIVRGATGKMDLHNRDEMQRERNRTVIESRDVSERVLDLQLDNARLVGPIQQTGVHSRRHRTRRKHRAVRGGQTINACNKVETYAWEAISLVQYYSVQGLGTKTTMDAHAVT